MTSTLIAGIGCIVYLIDIYLYKNNIYLMYDYADLYPLLILKYLSYYGIVIWTILVLERNYLISILENRKILVYLAIISSCILGSILLLILKEHVIFTIMH